MTKQYANTTSNVAHENFNKFILAKLEHTKEALTEISTFGIPLDHRNIHEIQPQCGG